MAEARINQDTVIRYLLTIGFTLFIFVILFLFLIVSRLVLSDVTPFGEHVKTTQNLLEDIDKVEKAVIQDPLIPENNTYTEKNSFVKFNYVNINITSIAYTNINENKSIITLVLDKEIEKTQNELYYFKIKNLTTLEKGEIIVYDSLDPKLAEFIEFEEELAIVAEKDLKTIHKIEKTEILGRVLLNQKND